MMRVYFLAVTLLLQALVMYGQKMPKDYYDEAQAEGFRNKSLALANYAYLVEHYPKNGLCSKAYCCMGSIYADEHHEKQAIGAYKASLSAADEKSRDLYYSAYDDKPAAAYQLAGIYEKNKNYDSALYFLYLFDTGFVKFYGCGNEAASVKEQTIVRYADLNLKAGRPRSAEQALLSMQGYGANMNILGWEDGASDVMKKLKSLFKKYEHKAMLKAEIEQAVTHYFMDSVYRQRNGGQDTTIYLCYQFLGAKVRHYYKSLLSGIPYTGESRDTTGLPEEERNIASLKKSEPYLMVQEL